MDVWPLFPSPWGTKAAYRQRQADVYEIRLYPTSANNQIREEPGSAQYLNPLVPVDGVPVSLSLAPAEHD